ncbi:MAG: hypothetical protein HY648_04070 [Acidobacteria bacterium]|nr:hypothetical protein [Acidobacteriota bacterium]
MRWKLSLFLPLFTLIGFSVRLCAQEPDEGSWENLNQIQAGQTIQVVQMDLKSRKGTFLRVSDEAIFLRVKGNDVNVPRADVLRVSRLDIGKRRRNMMVGLGVGTAAGMLIGAAVARPYFDEGTGFKPLAIILTGAGVGAGIGITLGASSGFQTVYRIERKQESAAP